MWVVNGAGRNLLRFGTGALETLGRAGDVDALYGLPARFLADAAVAPYTVGSSQPGRTMWLADAGAHVVVGLPLGSAGPGGAPVILGGHDVPGSDDQHFRAPGGVAATSRGTLFVSDSDNHRVQVFDAQGRRIATLGQSGVAGGGPGQLNQPARLALAGDDRLFVADSGNHRVVEFDVANPAAPREMRTIGRSGLAGSGPDTFDTPLGLAVDATFLYVADSGNGRVQVLERGSLKPWRSLDGSATERCGDGSFEPWDFVSDVALDQDGNLFVALPQRQMVQACDAFTLQRRLDLGRGQQGVPYRAGDALHNAPAAVAPAPGGGVVVVEGEGQRAVRRGADGTVAWVLGQPGVAGAGSPAAPRFHDPSDAAFLPDGRIVVADAGNGRLVVLAPDGRLDSVWGVGDLRRPTGLGVTPDGGLAVADAGADAGTGRVLRYDATGILQGELMGPGGPLALDAPADVATDAAGNWYVSEPDSHVVRVFDAAGGPLRTLGQPGVAGADFGHLFRPTGLALDGAGRLLVADSGNERVQVFAADGTFVTTVGGRRGAGSGGLREPRGVAVGPNGRVYIADTYNHRVQVLEPATEPWLPQSVNGFGARGQAAVTALAELDGRLYAGLRGTSGATIWRRDGNGPWEQMAGGGFGDARNVGVTVLTPFGNHLYAGVENLSTAPDPATGGTIETSSGGGIWRSNDGRSWTQVAADGFGDAHQSALGPFAAFGGRLYAGTRSVEPSVYPAQLWRSASGDSGRWERVRLDLIGRAAWSVNQAVSALAVYSGTLLVGTCGANGGQVWASPDGSAWRPAGQLEPGADPATAVPELGGTQCVTSLHEYDSRLYAGLGTDERLMPRGARDPAPPPVMLLRCVQCDGSDWEDVAAGGFGNTQNNGPLLLAPLDEPPFRYLYAFAGNGSGGLEVWRAPDGQDWEQVANGGLGDDNNGRPGGVGAVLAYRGRLHLGTENVAQGGELWFSGGTRPQVAPTPPAATATPTPRPRPQPSTGRARYVQVEQWPVSSPLAADMLAAPLDMAVAADGTVFVLDGAPARVLRLRPDGLWAAPFGAVGVGPDRLTRVSALALDEARGRLYVADVGTRRVVAFDLDGDFRAVVANDTEAVAIALRPDGTLWLADRLAGAVRLVAADGRELERIEDFGVDDGERFTGLTGVVEEPGGRLWVADQDGARLRAFETDAGGRRALVLTRDLGQGAYGRCTGQRLQILNGPALLAGGCRMPSSGVSEGFPENHRGSDLYFVQLRTANAPAAHYVALATYDVDRDDPANPIQPAVVRYFDDGFDIVTEVVVARPYSADTSSSQLDDPFRIDALPGGDVVVSDANALRADPLDPGFFRRFTPDGLVVDKLAVRSYPSQNFRLMLRDPFGLATGEIGQVMGVSIQDYGSPRQPSSLELLSLGRTVVRRYCAGGQCSVGQWLEPSWQTTLVNRNVARGAPDYNYAAAFEPTRRQYVLLQLWASDPSDMAMPARLFLFAVDGRGRKTAIPLDGTERQALWTDVDAGPDGHIHVLDTLNDRVQVLDADGNRLRQIETPKDAWKVAGGPNGEVFVLTTYGHVVRLAADGSQLSRFLALPTEATPPDALSDLAVDEWGRVYVVDNLYDQVTAFDPEGTEEEVLQGERCSLAGDKWVAPDEILLGDTAQLYLQLFGSCGFVEDDSDIVLMMNAMYARDQNPSLFLEAQNLRVARQIFSVIDLDRHRVGFATYVISGHVDQPLTQDRAKLIRALYDVTTSRSYCFKVNTESALRVGREMFKDTPPGRRKVLVLIRPDMERLRSQRSPGANCSWTVESVRPLAAQLRAEGILILAVNGTTAACAGDATCGIPVAERGQGTGRRAVLQGVTRRWPDDLVQSGTLTDQLPANIDFVPGSANPPALWDAASRTLRWDLSHLARGAVHDFSLRIRPRQEGLWPTNVEAAADAVDGWGRPQRAVLPIPKIRVYGELPPTPTFTPTRSPEPTVTQTPEPTPSPRPTRPPVPMYLPILLRTEPCRPDSRHADVALVIDTSGSMTEVTSPGGPTKLEAAREAARAFVLQLVAGRDQAAVLQFNNEATVLEPLTPDIARAASGLDRLSQASGTRLDLALEAAAAELGGPNRRADNNAVIVLLTDGAPTGVTPDEVRVAAAGAKAAGLLVFTIGLGQDVDQALLGDVASRPEWYFHAPDTGDLNRIYEQIAYSIPCKPMWP